MMISYTLIYVSDNSGFQIQSLLTINVVFLILNGKYRSYQSRAQNRIELVNEVITMVSYYHLFFFSEMIPSPEFKFEAGYTLVYCSIVCALFNFSVIGNAFFRQIRGSIIKKRKINSYLKEMKRLNEERIRQEKARIRVGKSRAQQNEKLKEMYMAREMKQVEYEMKRELL